MPALNKLFDLTERVALVTGGSRGIGREIAEGLAEAGASLMILARRESWMSATVAALKGMGFCCEGMVCDVSNIDEVGAAVSETLKAFGRIDILVNNAGVTWGAPAEDMPIEKWRTVLDTNLTGAFLCCQAAGREMIRQQYGRIINIASINAIQGGLPMQDISNAGYVASKGGLVALTRELAAKWARHGIRVNAIAPGYFATRMTEKIWEQAEQMARTRVPMGRGGMDGELKGVAVFLAAAASDYITGQTIVVDGGAVLI